MLATFNVTFSGSVDWSMRLQDHVCKLARAIQALQSTLLIRIKFTVIRNSSSCLYKDGFPCDFVK